LKLSFGVLQNFAPRALNLGIIWESFGKHLGNISLELEKLKRLHLFEDTDLGIIWETFGKHLSGLREFQETAPVKPTNLGNIWETFGKHLSGLREFQETAPVKPTNLGNIWETSFWT
jgi:hypothetical protein